MLMGLLCAEPCHTIASGNWNDPAVWDCGCDPVLCDTLYVEHDLLTTDPVVYIDAAYLRIEASGSLTGSSEAVSYTHLRAHETVLDLVCRLLLEKKNNQH